MSRLITPIKIILTRSDTKTERGVADTVPYVAKGCMKSRNHTFGD